MLTMKTSIPKTMVTGVDLPRGHMDLGAAAYTPELQSGGRAGCACHGLLQPKVNW